MVVPTETLIKHEPATTATAPPPAESELDRWGRRHTRRVRRLEINALAWVVGMIALTTLWIVSQWQANGAFEHFGFEGNHGDWNPTLFALATGLWTLAVGIMALQVRFERPPTDAQLEADAEPRRLTLTRLERLGRLKFHVAAWVLGMLIVTPLWALIEWQDNGGFERWSDNSQPGSWEPWILYIGGIWALVVAGLAVRTYVQERRSG
jgi:hypothetical protein